MLDNPFSINIGVIPQVSWTNIVLFKVCFFVSPFTTNVIGQHSQKQTLKWRSLYCEFIEKYFGWIFERDQHLYFVKKRIKLWCKSLDALYPGEMIRSFFHTSTVQWAWALLQESLNLGYVSCCCMFVASKIFNFSMDWINKKHYSIILKLAIPFWFPIMIYD